MISNHIMVLLEQIREVREGGAVERAHTVPHHGSYNNAQHQWGAAMLYLQLHPDPQMDTLSAILTHDLGERWVGDIPAPTKWAKPELKKVLSEMEQDCLDHLGLDDADLLEEEEARWLKAVDLLDLYLWTLDQQALGNQHVKVVTENILKYVDDHADDLPEEVLEVYDNFQWDRSADDIPNQ